MDTEKFNKYSTACSQPQSNYAVDNFVDGAQLTPERRFRQAVIELDVAEGGYEEALYEQKKLCIERDALTESIRSRDFAGSEYLLAKLKLDRYDQRIARRDRALIGKKRELDRHELNLCKFEKSLGFTEDTTEEEVYTRLQDAESEHYLMKLAMDTATHLLSRNGGPPVGVLNAIHQLPAVDLEKFQGVTQGMLHFIQGDKYNDAIHGSEGVSMLINISKGLPSLANRQSK